MQKATPEGKWYQGSIFVIYLMLVLFCLTFSQKLLDIPQNLPFLYVGLSLVLLHIFLLFLRFLYRGKSKIETKFVFLVALLCAVFISALGDVRATKDYLITGTAHLAFLFSFGVYLGRLRFDVLISRAAWAIVVFSLLEATVAWLFLAGVELTMASGTYYHQLIWGMRLHGIAGEPAHFGAIMGVSVLSVFFLYSSKTKGFSFLSVVVVVFLCASLLMSGTRNAIISTITGLVVFLKYKGRLRVPWYAWIVFFGAFSALLLIVSSETGDLIANILRVGDSNSQDIRIEKLANAFNFLSESSVIHLLFGYGFDYIINTPSFMNQYLSILIGFGLSGILCLLLLVDLVVKRLRVLLHSQRNIAAFGLALLSSSLVYFLMLSPLFGTFHIMTFAFYLAIFIAFSRYRIDKESTVTSNARQFETG